MAINTYHEARGEPTKGQLAVIFTVLNRVKDSRFPNTACGVIAQKGQFEWYNKKTKVSDGVSYRNILNLVKTTINGNVSDPTNGALYFNSHHRKPKGSKLMLRVGNHSFYR